MKRTLLFPIFGLIIITMTAIFACQKKGVEKQKEIASGTIPQSPKWGANDDKYLADLKKFSNGYQSKSTSINKTSSFCISSGQDSTFGWFTDADGDIVEGPYVQAKAEPFESNAENCPEIITLAGDAHTYLVNEGYSDISAMYVKPHWKIHAANTVLHLKHYVNLYYSRSAGLWNCVLQAVGYGAISELLSDWAILSRQQIIRKVGKLITKHMGFFGAIIAITSFIDCITD